MREIENDTHSVSSTFTDEFQLGLAHDLEKGPNEVTPEEPECLAQKVAKEDEKSASRWKLVVLVLLSVNAVVIVLGTYKYLVAEEEKNVKNAFALLANTVIDAAQHQASNLEDSFLAAGDTLAVMAETSGSTFPNITIPHFDVWAGNILELTGTELVGFAPIVNDTQQKRIWESYALPWSNGTTNTPKIFALEGSDDGVVRRAQRGPGPYAPVWQLYPDSGHEGIIKFDLLSNSVFQRMYEKMVETGRSVMSPVLNLEALMGDPRPKRQDGTSLEPMPRSVFFQPVYSQVGANATTSALSGVLFGVVSWEDSFRDLLEGENESLYSVVENDCSNQKFTVLIHGNEATSLGSGDRHNETINEIMVSTEFGDIGFEASHRNVGNETYQQTQNHCKYRFDLYSTSYFVQAYKSDLPLVVSVAVATMFFITAAAFGIYVTYIQNRQNRLLSIATHTSKIVSGLFPTSVRDRILKDAEDQAFQALIEEQEATNKKSIKVAERRRSSVLGQLRSSQSTGSGDFSFLQEHLSRAAGNMLDASKAPIAEEFVETTVFFGDIVGFTAWSAVRPPTEVFHLLETLYGAFDKFASRHSVYKVETVGDCYVAVTGVPSPNPQHSVAMACFALDCMASLRQILTSLGDTLGKETCSLNMRIGLHSGKVTGGVLRGDRGRFQLFGDSVNTAARIETSGMPGRIHLSETTADGLIAAGKSSWVVPREDKVLAKGKGELTTYWLEKRRGANRRDSQPSANMGGAAE
ncbi:Receptor-type guanylate cyclase gcy [Seminavis robusta]|uniref:Receptor-type guanylate cyclase gcy n=1 Tax=Seminavis robusta TaxID=568900 RepID=A0A9N8H7S6_9STRA|nr:Receptor-type guanylate cyclase gcy [Seminavis robusta]|eukprot:Sro149_g068410.1 Receptor-type guanylate cyclase gcy (750) ;mRNA; f:40005-42802